MPGDTTRKGPDTSYLICYTARSGSTLLSDVLSATSLAGYPEEYFNTSNQRRGKPAIISDPVWEEHKETVDIERYVDLVRSIGTSPNGVFGSKVNWTHLCGLTAALAHANPGETLSQSAQLNRVLPGCRYVWVTRRDKVQQAVSLAKAWQSDVWIRTKDDEAVRADLHFNFRQIAWYVEEIVHEEASWAEFFRLGGIRPLTVVYEDLVGAEGEAVASVLRYLEVAVPEGLVVPAPRVIKQADATSEQWVRRYYEEYALREARRARLRRWMGRGALRKGASLVRSWRSQLSR